MDTNKTKSHIFSTGISLLGIFCIFFFADFLSKPLPFELKCVDSKSLLARAKENPETKIHLSDFVSMPVRFKDSTIFICSDADYFKQKICRKDTSIRKILFIGDSQVEYLKSPVYNYCANNNYELVATVVWYSSTTLAWASGDTLENFIAEYDPDFVIIALGLNELFIKNMESRRKHIRTITNKIAERNISYYWIGPAAWTKDDGIVNVMQEEMGKQFYPSQHLTLKRASDKRHPTRDASKIWFDSVAVAMNIHTPLSFVNKVTEYKNPEQSPTIALGLIRK